MNSKHTLSSVLWLVPDSLAKSNTVLEMASAIEQLSYVLFVSPSTKYEITSVVNY